jgi:acyl-CoA reductase-like NAD-dependent aldehyde dehydrogenase
MEYQLFINGRWVKNASSRHLEVKNKYNGETVGVIPIATRDEVEEALVAAQRAAQVMADLPAHKRADILSRTAAALSEQKEDIARCIAAEAGKALKFARAEVERAISTFQIAAEESKHIHGETIPLDAVPSGEGFFGFTVRRPVGVVVAISPFNFPLNLVAHKIAPAIAAGNSIVLKPASTTPLTAVKLCQALEKAGLPAGAINLVVGSGGTVGEWLISDPRVSKITFTGSPEIGRHILARAGIKKVTLELGNTSPVIIAPDADIEYAAKRCALGAFYNSGQVCISVQRVYGDRQIFAELQDKFIKATNLLVVGDPLDERTDVGPMIDLGEAERTESWVDEARVDGATVLTGGKRQGPIYWPTVLTDVKPEMKVVAQEIFGPVASLIEYGSFEDALRMADNCDYGLQAAVFTRDINRVFQAVKRLNFGGVIINEAPTFRADHMPYGGTRQSGLGKEGIKYAIEEMTHLQMVAIKLG